MRRSSTNGVATSLSARESQRAREPPRLSCRPDALRRRLRGRQREGADRGPPPPLAGGRSVRPVPTSSRGRNAWTCRSAAPSFELPRDAKEVFVANPPVANAVVRSTRKLFLIGVVERRHLDVRHGCGGPPDLESR